MAKKNGFGRFLMFCTVVGAACAGAYYYMNKQDKELADDFDDDFDDFDDFSDEEELKENRKYVNLGHEQDGAPVAETSAEPAAETDSEPKSKSPEKTEPADTDNETSQVKTTTEDFFDDTK